MWNGWWLYWFLERRFYEHQIKCARHHHHFQN
jgi:hypothetical protein